MERRLISKDQGGIKNTVKQLTNFAKELNPLIEAYNVLNIGKYNNDVYQSQLTYRGDNETKIYLSLERERLVKAGITNEVSIQGILKTHETTLQEYKEKINRVLEKRSEAEIVKAANISDINFLDPAKDVGGGLRGPKTSVNYILAAMIGFLIPLLVIFVITLLDNSINTTEDIRKLTAIPLIGVIGKKNTDNNLSVFEKPKSPLAESCCSIRS
mgnify:CR=1 FL=1